MPKAPKKGRKKTNSRSDDIRPTIEVSSSAQIKAAYKNWRLLDDGDTHYVKTAEECEEGGLMEVTELPNFTPKDHADRLKAAGYEKVRDQEYHKFGNITLFIFRLVDDESKIWLSKSGFEKALGKKVGDKFIKDADLRKKPLEEGRTKSRSPSGSKTPKQDKGNVAQNHNGSNAATADEDITSDDGEGVDAVSDSESENESISESKAESEVGSEVESAVGSDIGSDDDSDDDGGSDHSPPSPKRGSPSSKPTSAKSKPISPRSKPTSSSSKTSSVVSNIIFARKVGREIQGLFEKNGKYDIKVLKSPPPDHMYDGPGTGFAPIVDKKFITRLKLDSRLDPEEYELRGCPGFRRGVWTTWRVAVLELKDRTLKEELKRARKAAGLRYTGPLLCSLTQFRTVVLGDMKKADELFNKTKLARILKAEYEDRKARGLPDRKTRHETFDPDENKALYDSISKLQRQNEEQDADIKRLTARMDKLSKL